MARPAGESVFNKRSKRHQKILNVMRNVSLAFAAIVNKPVDTPTAWKGYREKLKAVDELFKKAKKSWMRFADLEVSQQFKEGFRRTNNFLRRRFLNKPINTGFLPKVVDNLTNQITADFFEGLDAGRKETFRLFRLTQQSAISEAQINNALLKGAVEGTPRALKREIQTQLQKTLGSGKVVTTNRITGNKRHFDPETYADLVARTRTREAQSLGTIQSSLENGNDLVRVSDHNTTTDICMPFEGQVFSISGSKESGFPALTRFPPFHPNCQHVLTPFIESPKDTARGQAQRDSIFKIADRNERQLMKLREDRLAENRSVRGATREAIDQIQKSKEMAERSLG